MKITLSFILARLAELIIICGAFWLIQFWVIHYEKKLDAFSTSYDISLQHSDVIFFSILFSVFITGYYLMVWASKEYHKRFTETDIDLIKSNSKIVRMRSAALACMYISISIVGNTASGLTDRIAVSIFILPAFAIGVGLAPYYIYHNLTSIFTLKYSITVTLTMIAITFVAGYLHFPPSLAFVFTGIPILTTLTKKFKLIDRFMKTGKTDLE